MDYHLKPIGKLCAATGEELAPGSRCYSVLVEQNGEMQRLDYSESGWSGPPTDAVGHWRCVVPEPVSTRSKLLDPEALMQYFEQLSEDAIPAREQFRYVLSLLLLQKRRLKVEGSRNEGEIEYLQLSGSHGEGPFEVQDQKLSEEEVAALQAELNTHLANEWC